MSGSGTAGYDHPSKRGESIYRVPAREAPEQSSKPPIVVAEYKNGSDEFRVVLTDRGRGKGHEEIIVEGKEYDATGSPSWRRYHPKEQMIITQTLIDLLKEKWNVE